MDEKKMFDKAKKPITRGYADHKITTLQEGFAATNNLADLEEIKVPENCNVCDDGSTPITDDLFELAHHDTSEAERIGYSNYSYWGSTFRVFFKKKISVILLVFLVALLAFTFIQPLLPNQKD